MRVAEAKCHNMIWGQTSEIQVTWERKVHIRKKKAITFAAYSNSGFLDVPSFKVCFCFKYLGGIEQFDSLEKNFTSELSAIIFLAKDEARERWNWGKLDTRKLSQVDKEGWKAPAHSGKENIDHIMVPEARNEYAFMVGTFQGFLSTRI